MKTKQIGWGFVGWWALATTIGFVVLGLLVSIVAQNPSLWGGILFFLSSGYIIALPQSLVLRKYVAWGKKWMTVNALVLPWTFIRAALFVGLIFFVLRLIFPGLTLEYSWDDMITFHIDGLLFLLVYGFIVGDDTRELLKERFQFSLLWLLGSTLAWSVGMIVPLFSLILLSKIPNFLSDTSNPLLIGIPLFFGIFGISIGFISGVSLFFELRRDARQKKNEISSIPPEK